MYNAYAAGAVSRLPGPRPATQAEFSGPASTVLIAEGSGLSFSSQPLRINVGYSASQDAFAWETQLTQSGLILQTAIATFATSVANNQIHRHAGGGNFVLADGHARWLPVRMVGSESLFAQQVTEVFFPRWWRLDRTHGAGEPDPGGEMSALVNGTRRTYRATFHLN